MATYDKHFFEEEDWNVHWSASAPNYWDMDIKDQFDKLYKYVLELEERIEQLEKKNDDDQFYYREQQEKNS